MKKQILMLMGLLGLGVSVAQSQTVLLNSWENSLEGWSILETNWISDGFSTSNGVTQGSYSWKLTASKVDYGPTLRGPALTNLTLLMANAGYVNMDVQVDTNDTRHFNWGIQVDLEVVQPGGIGTMSVDGYNYPGGIFGSQLTDGSENTLTWNIAQAVRTALDAYPNLPCYLQFSIGGGGGGTIYIDNLRVTEVPQVAANLWVRELWDDLPGEQKPATTTVTNNPSSVGFSATDPWVANPSELLNCQLMAFRPGFANDVLPGQNKMGLPTSLDGSSGCLVQENSGISFFPNTNQGSFWTAGDFMTRLLTPNNFINFHAAGEYWFTITIANGTSSLYAQYVTDPASGWCGFGFADGNTTNSDFVAVGVTGLSVWLGPTNSSPYHGDTNVSKTLYISQGTLGQPGDTNTAIYNPIVDPSATPPDQPPNYAPPYNQEYSQTNFSGGPYHINAFGAQTVGNVAGDYIVLLGHLKTSTNGTATLNAKYYGIGVGGNPWNTTLDTSTTNITWDCSYSFNFNGTLTRMLLFQNGQFPCYMFGFRASTNFNEVVGLDPGYIQVSPLANTYAGYPINMTNLAAEANSYSFATPPAGYGTLTYQWYQQNTNGNLLAISGATNQYLNIAFASTNDPSMPLGTDAGTYVSMATDPSGTWGSVSSSAVITVTKLDPPLLTSVQLLHNQTTFVLNFNEPNLTGVSDLTHYVFNDGIVITNLAVINTSTGTQVQITTGLLPPGTRITLSVSGVTNVVGGTLAATNLTLWTDLIQSGVANWDAWQYPAIASQNDYFNNFVPANPYPVILQSMTFASWDGPRSGVTILGTDGYVGDGWGNKTYGWFVPPVTTNYVFYISCDDGGRLSLSTNDSPANLRVIACESLWSGADEWTNVNDQYPTSPHRGDGTASAIVGGGYLWDNSVAGQSPATACLQNRSDQFIVAYWDSSGITGAPGEPPGATNQANWATAASQVTACVPPSMTNFWPNVDANGQALIHLQAGQRYYMQLEHVQMGGGYNMDVTYKVAGQPDPYSGVPGTSAGSASALTSSIIAGTVPFSPTISIAKSNGVPQITYTGVLLTGPTLFSITNQMAISSNGPSLYIPVNTITNMFYRTSR